MSAAPAAPLLDGITVLDFTRVLAGPYCTRLLADLGARVIKVERPGEGDDTRRGYIQLEEGRADQATYFVRVNAGKRSIALDLSQPARARGGAGPRPRRRRRRRELRARAWRRGSGATTRRWRG